LKQIHAGNVERLGLAWSLDLDVTNSITAPLAIDGVIYLAAGYSVVHAINARTGKLLWRFDPGVPAVAGERLRIGWGIRGLAAWKNKLYVGTQDGRLLAIDAGTGELVWSVQTVDVDGVFISGPPRVFNNKVLIGNGGADFVPMRGYVTAYDAESGEKAWRFYIVPGKPGVKDGEASDPAMDMAAPTWTGEWWKHGGGGAVWNALTYDPELNRVYLGTGNSGPYNEEIRNPGGGDNLFIASIVALDADTGKYIWHYQNTPNDIWDYNSSQDIPLATITLDGKPRRVMFHAPKNGFFYVIDRDTGMLISAEKLGTVTWAERIDLDTGRPVVAPNARYGEEPVLLWPSFQGTHHWPPQSFSPLTGLVYVPILEMPSMFARIDDEQAFDPLLYTPDFTGLASGDGDVPPDGGTSVLKAWDPQARKAAWQIETPGISNGGTMATAGNLVFQGLADGWFHAYRADNGEDVWKLYAGVAVTGVPITYSVDGEQYVSITAGPLHGASAAFGSVSAQWGWDSRIHPRRLLTFKLDGKAKVPPTPPPVRAEPLPAPQFELDEAQVVAGLRQYMRCMLCHGPGAVAGGNAPDLRASPVLLSKEAFSDVVQGGTLVENGMPGFPELSDSALEQLRHYIRAKARGLTVGPDGTVQGK
jgi:quinohemoprotein ethanol dehydrogenase